MRRLLFPLLILAGLVYSGLWLKNYYQDFVKEALERYMPKDKQQTIQKRNQDEPEPQEESQNEENKHLEEPTNLKALPTNAPNTQKIQRKDKELTFNYIFRDAKDKGVQFSWSGSRALHEIVLPKKFGLPKDFFQQGRYTQEQIDNYLKKGSFKQAMMEGKLYTIPDYNKIARDNKVVTAPIYKMMKQYLGKNLTQTKLIETLMTFCQDIPYKRPPASRGKRYTGELDVPAKMLAVGTGDCDTKSVFFASTLLHHQSIKVAVVLVDNPSHMFAAIRGVPTPYQAYIEYQGEKYIVCEPVGNARLPVGKLGFPECRTRLVVKMIP